MLWHFTIGKMCFPEHELWELCMTRYHGKPRAATALECLRVVREIQERSSEVTAPLLVLHGEMDLVTDAKGSIMLHSQASSCDKTLYIYPGMWHQLVGEPQPGCDKVFGDVHSWLDARAPWRSGAQYDPRSTTFPHNGFPLSQNPFKQA